MESKQRNIKTELSIIAAVAEMGRENIRVQTMAGREQKAREGKWNGGFASYGYKLENGELVIAEDEVEIIQMIFERYIHTNDGINSVANYLNTHGYTKKLRQNRTIPGFSSSFIKKIIDNPVYMGKIAYGRRRTEKKTGTRNETHIVEQSEFPVYEGIHEANLDVTDIHYDKKISDLQRRLDTQYDKIDEVEEAIADLKSQVYELKKNQIDADSIYGFLNAFNELYAECTNVRMLKRNSLCRHLLSVLIYFKKDEKMVIGLGILSFNFQYRFLEMARK